MTKSKNVVIDAAIAQSRIVRNTATKKYFKLGLREADFLDQLDGSATAEELRAENCSRFAPDEVDHLIAWFKEHRLIDTGVQEHSGETQGRLIRLYHLLIQPDKWRLQLFNPDQFLEKNIGFVHALLSRPALGCYLLIFFLPIFILIADPNLFKLATQEYQSPLTYHQWVIIYLGILSTTIFHELGHAITCKHFGGEVHKIGVMLLYLQPVMFCDISDSWRFAEAEKRVMVAAAGIFVQFLISSISFCTWAATDSPLLLHFTMVNIAIAIFNLFPLIKLDGYWMLVHILDEPNLRKKGFQELDHAFRRSLGHKFPNRTRLKPHMFAFGLGSVISIPAFWALGLYGIYNYASKLSQELAIALVLMIFLPVAYRASKSTITYLNSLNAKC